MNIELWPHDLQILFGVMPFILCIVGIGISQYLGHGRNLEIMLDAFSKSHLVFSRSWLLRGGYAGRLLLVTTIGMVVLFPRRHLYRGLVVREDLENFPKKLKSWLTLMSFCLCGGFIWGVALYLMVLMSR